MKRTNLTILFDCLATFIGLGLIFLCLFRYYGLNLALSAIASALLAFSVSIAIGYLLFFKRRKTYLKRRDEEEKNKLMLHLTLLTDEKAISLLSQTIESPFIKEDKSLKTEEKRYLADFTMQPVSADEIVKIVKKYPSEKIMLWCNELTPQADELARRLNIERLTGREVYLSLKQRQLLPENYLLAEKQKRTPKEQAETFFAASNTRSFFSCGVGLLLLSFFTIFPFYYRLIGSILVLTSLAVRWLGYKRG